MGGIRLGWDFLICLLSDLRDRMGGSQVAIARLEPMACPGSAEGIQGHVDPQQAAAKRNCRWRQRVIWCEAMRGKV